MRSRNRLWLGVAWGLVVATAGAAQAAVPMEKLLPNTTTGFLAVSNADRLDQQWKKTQLGQLMEDQVMKAFREDMRQQMQQRWAALRQRLGLGLEDVRDVASGEVALALIEPKPGEAAAALLADVTGRADKAKALLAKARADLLKQGAKETSSPDGSTMLFSLPPKEADSSPAKRTGTTAAASPAPRLTIYFLAGNILGATDDLDVLKGIFGRISGAKTDSLADLPGFQSVMKRCATDAGTAVPQVRWFMYPLGYAEASRAATPKERRRRGKTVVEIIRNQGFGAVLGVGGFVDFAEEDYQVLHRTAAYAPQPWKNAMKMLVFPNHAAPKDFVPQDWVSREVATYATLYLDVLNAFDHFGSLFNEIFGEGEDVWGPTLEGMEKDPHGPKINLRKELVMKLGQRVTMITDYELPITPSSERLLLAIEVNDEKSVAEALRKLMENDPTVKKRVVNGRVIWETIEEDEGGVPSISIRAPSLIPGNEPPSLVPGKPAAKDEGEERQHLLPHRSMTVANGHLLIASHMDFLLKVLKPVAPKDLLRNDLEYQRVTKVVEEKLGFKEWCARQFSRTDEEFRPSYELIRQGKMPESQSLLGRMLNNLLGAARRGVAREQRIQGKNLPDYQVVRRSLGPAGTAVASEPNGWFVKGFMVGK